MNEPTPTPHTSSRTRLLRAGFFLALPALGSVAFAQGTAPTAAGDDDVVKLSPFHVSTERDVGYRASNSIAGTRSNTPIKDIPLNIQVFTKDFYEDLLITNQVDLERYNASLINGSSDVRSTNPIQQAYNAFLFRGFVQNWGLRDGIREYDPIDTQGLARVEVVKGPAAALYGLAYPGGVMNNVTKDVDFQRNFTSLRFIGDSEGELRATIDANYTGDVAGGEFGLRFNGANSETRDDRAHSEGAIRYMQIGTNWRPMPTTEIKFLAERGYREKPNGLGYFTRGETDALGNSLGNGSEIPLQIFHPEIPWEWNWSNGLNMRSLETHLYRGTINQTLGDNFSATAYIQYSKREQIDGNGWDANGSGGADSWEAGGGWIVERSPTGQITRETIQAGYSYRDWNNSMHSYGATGVYKLDLGAVNNTFTFGANVWSEKFLSRSSTQTGANPTRLVYPVAANIDTTNVPPGPPSDLVPVTTGNGYQHEDNSNDYYFAAWQASFFENRLKTNVAINRTNLKLVQWANGQATVPNITEQSKNSPMYGVMFDLTKDVSIFAVHSTSLFPTTDKNTFGTQMPPVVGKSNEVGVKVELLDGKISGTISYYMIEQSGGAQTDPTANNLNTQRWDAMTPAQREVAFPGQTRANLLGDLVPGSERESKGFEADLIFQPTRNWQILFSYAHNDNEVTSSLNAATIGQPNVGSIKDQYSLLTKYSFLDGSLKNLYVGVGLQAAGKALQGYQGGVARYNPSTFWAEAFAGYRFKVRGYNLSLQLNVKNITEQEEFVGWRATGSSTTIATQRYEIGTPMRTSLALGIDF
ncbi:MAG TPA: TonB-dependent receptor [Opitutus sp.]|nr:TonB-dependent receptor [Opitutus sp.]